MNWILLDTTCDVIDVEGGQVRMYGKAREGTQSSSINQRGTDQSHHDDLPGGYEEAIQTKV